MGLPGLGKINKHFEDMKNKKYPVYVYIVYFAIAIFLFAGLILGLINAWRLAFPNKNDKSLTATSTLQIIKVDNSNIVVGNSAPVNQNLTINPIVPATFALYQISKEKRGDGLWHTKGIIGIGTIVGFKEQKLIEFIPPPGITCSPFHHTGLSNFSTTGINAGRTEYTYEIECISKNQILEKDVFWARIEK